MDPDLETMDNHSRRVHTKMKKGLGDNCLEALYPQCEAHSKMHLNGESNKDTCEAILKKLKTILPRLAKSYFSPASSSCDDVKSMCKLYCMIISRNMCEHGDVIFDYGDLKAVMPCLTTCWRLVANAKFAAAHEGLIAVIVQLVKLVEEVNYEEYILLFSDMLVLLQDGLALLRLLVCSAQAEDVITPETSLMTHVAMANVMRQCAADDAGAREAGGNFRDGAAAAGCNSQVSASMEGYEAWAVEIRSVRGVFLLVSAALRALSSALSSSAHAVVCTDFMDEICKTLCSALVIAGHKALSSLPFPDVKSEHGGGALLAAVKDMQEASLNGLRAFIDATHGAPGHARVQMMVTVLGFVRGVLGDAEATRRDAGTHQLSCDPPCFKNALSCLLRLGACPSGSTANRVVLLETLPSLASLLELVMTSEPSHVPKASGSDVCTYVDLARPVLIRCFRGAIIWCAVAVGYLHLLDTGPHTPARAQDIASGFDSIFCWFVGMIKYPESALAVIDAWTSATGQEASSATKKTRKRRRSSLEVQGPERKKLPRPTTRSQTRGGAGHVAADGADEAGEGGPRDGHDDAEDSLFSDPADAGGEHKDGERDHAADISAVQAAAPAPPQPANGPPSVADGPADFTVLLATILRRATEAASQLKEASATTAAISSSENVERAKAVNTLEASRGVQVGAYGLKLLLEQAGKADYTHVQRLAAHLARLLSGVLSAHPDLHAESSVRSGLAHMLMGSLLVCVYALPLKQSDEESAALEPLTASLGKAAAAMMDVFCRPQRLSQLLDESEDSVVGPVWSRLKEMPAAPLGDVALDTLDTILRMPLLDKLLALLCCMGTHSVGQRPRSKPSLVNAALSDLCVEEVTIQSVTSALQQLPVLDALLQLLEVDDMDPRVCCKVLGYLPVLVETILEEHGDRFSLAVVVLPVFAVIQRLLPVFKASEEMQDLTVCARRLVDLLCCVLQSREGEMQPRPSLGRHQLTAVRLRLPEAADHPDRNFIRGAAEAWLPSDDAGADLVVITMRFAVLLDHTDTLVRMEAAKAVFHILSIVPPILLSNQRVKDAVVPVLQRLFALLQDLEEPVRYMVAEHMPSFLNVDAQLAQLMMGVDDFDEGVEKLIKQFKAEIRAREREVDNDSLAAMRYNTLLQALSSMVVHSPMGDRKYDLWYSWVIVTMVSHWSRMSTCCTMAFEQLIRITDKRFNCFEEALSHDPHGTFAVIITTLMKKEMLYDFIKEVLRENIPSKFLLGKFKYAVITCLMNRAEEELHMMADVWEFAVEKVLCEDERRPMVEHPKLQRMLLHIAPNAVARMFVTDNLDQLPYLWSLIDTISPKQYVHIRDQYALREIVWEMAEDEGMEWPERLGKARKALAWIVYVKHAEADSEGESMDAARVDELEDVTDKQIQDLLQDHFLYVANHRIISAIWSSLRRWRQLIALRCLDLLLQLLGPLRAVRYLHKILAIIKQVLYLKDAQDSPYLQDVKDAATEVLVRFVKMLPDAELRGNMSLLVVTVLPGVVCPVLPASEGEEWPDDVCRAAHFTASSKPLPQDAPCVPPMKTRTELLGLLQWLIVDKRESLKDSFVSIPALPNLPELEEARGVLSREVPSSGQLAGQVRRLLPLLSHESIWVQLAALMQLRVTLQKGRQQLFLLVTGNDEADDLISEIMTKLLRLNAQDNRQETVMMACCACLGELGAIDPARVNVTLHTRGAGAAVAPLVAPWKTNDARLALLIMQYILVPRLRGALEEKDRVPYAIQELLRTIADAGPARLMDQPTDTRSRRRSVADDNVDATQVEPLRGKKRGPMPDWLRKKLEEHDVLSVVGPFYNTDYQVKASAASASPPFFSSGLPFSRCLGDLSRWLSDQTRGPFTDVFYSCFGVIKRIYSLQIFALPYLVADAWCHGEKDTKAALLSEIMYVLTQKTGRAGGDGDCATQVILSLCDTLSDWCAADDGGEEEEQEEEATETESVACRPLQPGVFKPQRKKLRKLLALVPEMLRIEAALRIRAYARALKYLELYARRAHKQSSETKSLAPAAPTDGGVLSAYDAALPLSDVTAYSPLATDGANNTLPPLEADQINLFQRILANLGEPDGMAGLAAVRRKAGRPTTLRQRIREFEQAEEWSHALQGYEQAMQEHERRMDSMDVDGEEEGRALKEVGRLVEEGELAKGLMQCLLEMDQVESGMNQFLGMVARKPVLKPHLLSAGAEACWRLRKWPALRELLKEPERPASESPHSEEGSSGSVLGIDDHFQLTVGRVLLSLHERDSEAFTVALKAGRAEAMVALSAASCESYQRAYPLLIKLHVLHELEQGSALLQSRPQGPITPHQPAPPTLSILSQGDDDDAAPRRLLEEWRWDSRLSVMMPSVRTCTPVMIVRRTLFQMGHLRSLLAENFVVHATHAAEAGRYRLAESALRHAACLGLDGERLMLEEAKLLHAQDRVQEALLLLEPVDMDLGALKKKMLDMMRTSSHAIAEEIKGQAAIRLLLTTDWMVEAGLKHGQQVLDRYKLAHELKPRSENCFFSLAKYLDFLLEARRKDQSQQPTKGASGGGSAVPSDEVLHSYLRQAVENYAQGLQYGLEHIFQSMPRLLTLCFEAGAMVEEAQAAEGKGGGGSKGGASSSRHLVSTLAQKTLQQCMTALRRGVQQVSSCAWYTCLPQLLSQIGASQGDIQSVTLEAVLKVLMAHPEQAMWSVTGIAMSKDPNKKRVGEKLLKVAHQRLMQDSAEEAARMLTEGRKLFTEMIDLANQDVDADEKSRQLRITVGKRLNLTRFIVPVQAALTVSLPRPSKGGGMLRAVSPATYNDPFHDPFPNAQMQMRVIEDRAVVLMSKARPKRITIVTTCEKQVSFLCKIERSGDLRKDARVMEINGVVNRLLQRDAEGRRRKLRLRTYAVICLNEECGLMEWVPNTQVLRACVSQANQRLNVQVPSFRELRPIMEQLQNTYHDDVPTMARDYRELIMLRYPPSLHHWFICQFPEPTEWFEARTTFTRSAALWSAMGHVLGLGDRHGENILVDMRNGEALHVDFDCLFDKGLTLQRPELVPFRLTPNMVDAMGVTGYEGPFRRVMEVALDVLRDNRQTLLSVLEPFLNDPSLNLDHLGKNQLSIISDRLRGIYNLRVPTKPRSSKKGGQRVAQALAAAAAACAAAEVSLPLSVPGQVQKLIQEATSIENLAMMYVGWQPWI